jgi:hypothetical protein
VTARPPGVAVVVDEATHALVPWPVGACARTPTAATCAMTLDGAPLTVEATYADANSPLASPCTAHYAGRTDDCSLTAIQFTQRGGDFVVLYGPRLGIDTETARRWRDRYPLTNLEPGDWRRLLWLAAGVVAATAAIAAGLAIGGPRLDRAGTALGGGLLAGVVVWIGLVWALLVTGYM